MSAAAAMPALTWHRMGPGHYEAAPEGTATEFRATITRLYEGLWHYGMTTCGLPLDTGRRATLKDARAIVEATYYAVETGAR